MPRRVYFDPSALNRPFDDQEQVGIRLETEAVEHLLPAVGERLLEWISSDIVLFDEEVPRRGATGMLESLCHGATGGVALTADVSQRGRDLRARGLGDLDALHLASAEQGGAEVLLTTDDQFIRAARALQPASPVRVENPVIFELEVFQ